MPGREGQEATVLWVNKDLNAQRKSLGVTHRQCWERGLEAYGTDADNGAITTATEGNNTDTIGTGE